jgi:uncharacterized LabA/DUF88 family protein
MSRAAIFIDGAYLDFTMKNDFGGVRVDHSKFSLELLPPGLDLLRTYFYHCPPYQANPPSQDEKDRKARFDRFHSALQKLPRYEVRLGVLAKRFDDAGKVRFEQKRVDILLGVDLVRLSAKSQITEAIIVAGDSDFLPAIDAAKDDGVLIRLIHGRTAHDALKLAADERVQLDQAFVNRIKR